jgi:hypothetical protein
MAQPSDHEVIIMATAYRIQWLRGICKEKKKGKLVLPEEGSY